MSKFISFFLITLLCLIVSCDHGLEPPAETTRLTGFSGQILYRGTWPPNVQLNKLIASKVYRRFRDINEIVSLVMYTDSIKIYPVGLLSSLPVNVDTTQYQFELPAGEYLYIAVVQAHDDIANPQNWKIVGVYSDNVDRSPKSLVITENHMHKDIDIEVDFDNLPPQPFDAFRLIR